MAERWKRQRAKSPSTALETLNFTGTDRIHKKLFLNRVENARENAMHSIGLRWDFMKCTETYFGFCACIPMERIV